MFTKKLALQEHFRTPLEFSKPRSPGCHSNGRWQLPARDPHPDTPHFPPNVKSAHEFSKRQVGRDNRDNSIVFIRAHFSIWLWYFRLSIFFVCFFFVSADGFDCISEVIRLFKENTPRKNKAPEVEKVKFCDLFSRGSGKNNYKRCFNIENIELACFLTKGNAILMP